MRYYVLMFQCSGGCSDGQLQVATAAAPWGPFTPRGAVLPKTDPRSGSSQAGIWVDTPSANDVDAKGGRASSGSPSSEARAQSGSSPTRHLSTSALSSILLILWYCDCTMPRALTFQRMIDSASSAPI
eukprot:m.337069 g.337069  ORF g.337069 m.337069 type:complete len:128 (-) comp16533_c1_seq3:393-776(-)